VSARRDARAAIAPAGGPAFPPELLDENDPAWVDLLAEADLIDLGQGDFSVRLARKRRHQHALYDFAVEHGLMGDKYPYRIDSQKLRALAEAHGQHWPPRRIALWAS